MGNDREDFSAFAAAESTRLLRTAFLLTGDRGLAEDLVQDVLERLFVAWPRVEDPRAYARRALANHGHNFWRRRRRHAETPLTDAVERPVSDSTATGADRDALLRALATLPARQRTAVVLRFLDDLSEAETAQAMSCSLGTVKAHTSRALARLRVALPVADYPCAAPVRSRSTS